MSFGPAIRTLHVCGGDQAQASIMCLAFALVPAVGLLGAAAVLFFYRLGPVRIAGLSSTLEKCVCGGGF